MAFILDSELKKLKHKEKWLKIGFVFIFVLFLFVANQDMGVYVFGITTNTGSMKPYISDFCVLINKQYSDLEMISYGAQSIMMNESASNAAVMGVYDRLHKWKKEDIKIGDVISYRSPYYGIIGHRVVAECEGGVITKGDANKYEDNFCVPYGLINTKLLYKLC